MQDNPNDKALRDELLRVAKYALEWIDAVPKDLPLPTMPGFDRDWADRIIENAEQHHPPKVTQEPNRSAEVDVRQLAQESYTKYCQSYEGDFMAWHFWKRAYDCAWSDFALPFQQQIEVLKRNIESWKKEQEIDQEHIKDLKTELHTERCRIESLAKVHFDERAKFEKEIEEKEVQQAEKRMELVASFMEHCKEESICIPDSLFESFFNA